MSQQGVPTPQVQYMQQLVGRQPMMTQSFQPLPHAVGLRQHSPFSAQMQGFFPPIYEADCLTIPPSPSTVGPRARRRSQPSAEQVKHRRTRSGCFTCRNRRVKCDEGRPTCNRCRKGNRDCVYPDSQTGSRTAQKAKAAARSEESSAEDQVAVIKEGEVLSSDQTSLPAPSLPAQEPSDKPSVSSGRDPSKTPSLTHDESPSPSTEDFNSGGFDTPTLTSAARPGAGMSSKTSTIDRTMQDLSEEIQFYLEYYRTNVTYQHYQFKGDSNNHMKELMLKIAMQYDPLMYALAGFAAYLHTLTQPEGKMMDFLGFYNRAVSELRKSLKRNPKPSLATLLTTLQLATMEEFLGDWVNLMAHIRGAHEILTSLYDVHTAMRDETGRKVLQWYCRFDLFGSLMAGSTCALAREWYEVSHRLTVEEAQRRPESLLLKYEEHVARYRLLSCDLAVLTADAEKGIELNEENSAHLQKLAGDIMSWEARMDPALLDPAFLVPEVPRRSMPNDADIVDPYEPNVLYRDELFDTNCAIMDIWAANLMFQSQIAALRQESVAPEILGLAYKVCQNFAALEVYPQCPPGTLFAANVPFGIACMYLPKDERHTMWVKRKLAKLESGGFVYPPTFRARLSALWGEDCSEWWLPNDEGLPPIIRAIRTFISERSSLPRDVYTEDLHQMKGLFSAMTLEETRLSPGSSVTPPSQSPSLASNGFQENLDWVTLMERGQEAW